jgi:hypothetical protein
MVQPSLRDEAISGIVKLLVHTKRETEAAVLFLGWFCSRRGRATKGDVSRFADQLAFGERGFRYGRTTFYRYVLKTFIDHGLIGMESEIDQDSRRVVKVYKRIIQPAKGRRPSGPSLLYNAHLLAERWNVLFGG